MSNITISNLLASSLEKFKPDQDRTIIFDIQSIVCDVLNVDKTYLYLNPNKFIEPSKLDQIDQKISRLLKGEPLAYILGYKYFWEQKLIVTKDTLIPRADTEILIESVLSDIKNKNSELKVLDLGTGTGAIALALAGELPNSEITAIDISEKNLQIAKKNAKLNNINNVEFILSNWYEALKDCKFDIIVSNPPYIDYKDQNIDEMVKKNEPKQALFSDDNGLADIKIIISQAIKFLKNNSRVYIEHGFTQSKDVQAIFERNELVNIKVIKDLNNKDRCTQGFYSGEVLV